MICTSFVLTNADSINGQSKIGTVTQLSEVTANERPMLASRKKGYIYNRPSPADSSDVWLQKEVGARSVPKSVT